MTPACSAHYCCTLAAAIACILALAQILVFRSSISSFRSGLSVDFRLSSSRDVLAVYVANLSRDLNYGLLDSYWRGGNENAGAYPPNPLFKQYSAEYWLLGDLLVGNVHRSGAAAASRRVVDDPEQADVIFVPFFAALSAEMQLERARGKFRHRKSNDDFERQKLVLDILSSSPQWKISGGRDHVFVLTDPMAMWHFRSELANSILLIVDFGGWYMQDNADHNTSNITNVAIHHTQVSLIKDVVIPYTHLLPTLDLSNDASRTTLLYFKGARFRHRTGLVRDQLWNVLDGESGVVLETGFPNQTGQIQAMKGMRGSDFCLHPAGDTPTSCRLFDAIASLCIPVIVSDSIELPFEGVLDYTEFSLFVSVQDALQPKWLVQFLRKISHGDRRLLRQKLARVQHHFEYDNGFPEGRGPAIKDGAVDMIWKKVQTKIPAVREAIARNRRRPKNSALPPARCQCV